ncbi:MAG: M6 family metalloprotease domain-containing protein [Candidatus Zixiibacteriota bacterium]
MNRYRILRTILLPLVLLLLLNVTTSAVQISPEARQNLADSGELEKIVSLLKEAQTDGLDQPEDVKFSAKLSADEPIDTLTVMVLLVDFDDQPESANSVSGSTPANFDSILFSYDINPTGSMTEYYLENSYGKMLIRGQIFGWYRMPQLYSYYVDSSSGIGPNPYNSRTMTYHAILAADAAGVDFSQFDTFNDDNEIDGLVIVHSGPGMELTGDVTDMISHKTTLGSLALTLDGILVDAYSVQPEEYGNTGSLSPIGVFCHEFGHILGLFDLYDIDYIPASSDGVGKWSLMATGSYNNNSKSPAHMDAWSKAYVGFLQPTNLIANMTDVNIPQVENNPVVYKMLGDISDPTEYFLVENRQRIGFDQYIPGTGLLIYHVDELVSGDNIDVNHYHVAVEQADGAYQLEFSEGNQGDPGDPFPGASNKRSFDDLSTPNSRLYGNIISQVSVWDISDSDSLMTANLDIEWSRPYLELSNYAFMDANNNQILEPGEEVQFYFELTNSWKTASGATITMSVNDPAISFTNDDVYLATLPGDGGFTGNIGDPISFQLPDVFIPTFDSFFIAIETDGGSYFIEFAIQKQIGSPDILVVDDDRGASYDTLYIADLYHRLIPADVWNKNVSGTPPAVILNSYRTVFWFTGDFSTNKLNANDLNSLRAFLDGGGNLFMTGQGIAGELHTEDSVFLRDYLHARYDGNIFYPKQIGEVGSPIGDGLKIRYYSGTNQDYTKAEKILPVGDAIPAFSYDLVGGVTSLSYQDENSKVVFFDWGYEGLDNSSSSYAKRDIILGRIMDFFGRVALDADDYDNNRKFLPKSFSLEQNYPNPFNPTTTINYSISAQGSSLQKTILSIFNILGQEVNVLVNESQAPGNYSVVWDGDDKSGRKVASGIYFYRLSRDNESVTRKMVLLK